jgi:3',5'-cyclic AMP phosphodiesterase CpdA
MFLVSLPQISFFNPLKIEQEKGIIAYAHSSIPQEFNFGAVGDYDCNDNTQNTVNNIMDKDPELVISLGDYVYDNITADCWLQIVDPIDEKMKIAIGNHDVIPSTLLQQYMSHFNITSQYYSFDYQNIHFLVMGTEVPYDTASEQYDFANKDLSKAASNPNTDWVIVALHKPLYSSPSNIVGGYEIPLSVTYHPLFDKYGVDLVIQGHVHGYERSDPIKYNPESYTKPLISETNNTNNYVNPEGTIFVTVGTAGAMLHEFEGKKPFIVSQYSGFGFLNIDVTTNSSTTIMNSTFYNNDEGSIEDNFIVTKY